MTDQGYDSDAKFTKVISGLTDQDVEGRSARLTAAEFDLREDILLIQADDIQHFIEKQSYFKFKHELEASPHELTDQEAKEEDDGWEEEAERSDTPTDVDGDPSESADLNTAFDETKQMSDMHKRSFLTSKRQKMFDVVIKEDKEKWYVYTPATVIISRCVFNEGLRNVKKEVWLGNFVLKTINERQKHLLHIGELLIENIRRNPEFMTLQDRNDALASLAEFTPENIAEKLSIDNTTVGRLRNALFFIPRFGEISLDDILKTSKSGIDLLVKRIIAQENPLKPLSDASIAKKLPGSYKRTGRQIGNIRNELGIPGMSERKDKNRKAERA